MAEKLAMARSFSDSRSTLPFPCRHDNSPGSSEDDVPLHTSFWTQNSMDKLGVVVRHERSSESIIKEWCFNCFSILSEEELKTVNKMLTKADSCFKNIDFETIEEIRDSVKLNQLPTRLLKLINIDSETNFQFPGSPLTLFPNRGKDFLFTLSYVIENMEEDADILESQYTILLDKFLQMFGIKTMQKPFMKTKKSQIMGKTVHSQPDLLCFIPDPSRERPVLIVCEVKKNEPASDLEDFPPKKKPRPTVNSSMPAIPDSLFAQHVGDLLVYLNKSVSSRAVLGMTVEKTCVQFTLLLANEKTLEKLRTSDGRGPVRFEGLEESPRLYYSKPLNYIKREERVEFMKCLLYIRMMQTKLKN